MGAKNILIVFFSTVAVSLVILIILFSLFFKNVDLNFNTRLPETAPEIEGSFVNGSTMNPDSKAEGVIRSTVNVPPDVKEPVADTAKTAVHPAHPENTTINTPPAPVTDDVMLDNDNPKKNADMPGKSYRNSSAGNPSSLPPPSYVPTDNEVSSPGNNNGGDRRRETETAPPSRNNSGSDDDSPQSAPPVPGNPG